MKKLVVLLVLVALFVAALPAPAQAQFPDTNCFVRTKWYSYIPDAVFPEQHWVLFVCDGGLGMTAFMVPPEIYPQVEVLDQMIIRWSEGNIEWAAWTGITPQTHPLNPTQW